MKRNLFCLFIVFCFISCQNKSTQKNNEKEESELKYLISNAEKSDIIDCDLFLGFKFGMSKNDINSHLDSLRILGKIYIDDEGSYRYDFHTDASTILMGFSPEYYNDSLYQMDYILETSSDGVGNPSINIALATDMFMKTDRIGFKTSISEDLIGNTEYNFIKNNLIVCFHESACSGIMSYINAPIRKIVDDLSISQKNKNTNKTLSDF